MSAPDHTTQTPDGRLTTTSCIDDRLEKAAAKLPKKDLAAVKKRFVFLEVSSAFSDRTAQQAIFHEVYSRLSYCARHHSYATGSVGTHVSTGCATLALSTQIKPNQLFHKVVSKDSSNVLRETHLQSCVCMYTIAVPQLVKTCAGGYTEYRGWHDSNAQVCKQPGSILCSAAGASPHAYAPTHPHRD